MNAQAGKHDIVLREALDCRGNGHRIYCEIRGEGDEILILLYQGLGSARS